ncbi:Uncharacterized protein APZ42_013109 [Daphnia magna]|uniref:Uncharacterized protein n=1 Tax=Daphnia magna TaxID=35525 RepID=A0A162R626_9CRUS|nr:Uncharacterized protein APZ42_013109 [Daphnia magna]
MGSASELPTDDASEWNERHRRGSCRDVERCIGTGCRAIVTGDTSPIMEQAPAALRTPSRIDISGMSSHLKAVERLRRQWQEEENAKRYPFEWLIGCLFPLPLLVYLWIEYRTLSSHVDTLLLARLLEVPEPGEEDQGQARPECSRVNIVV